MTIVHIRAVYEAGHLRPLDPVDLREGQHVEVAINVTENDPIRNALGDLVAWPDPTDNRHAEIENQMDEIASAFSVGRSLSAIIIEDRGDV